MPDSGDTLVSQALGAVIRDHGWRVAGDPPRLRASLSDVLGAQADEHKGLVDALVVSAEEGAPVAVRKAGHDGLDDIKGAQLARLEEWGLSTERANWVLEAWVNLLPPKTGAPPDTATPPPTVSDDGPAVTVAPGGPPAPAASPTRLPAAPSAQSDPRATEMPEAAHPRVSTWQPADHEHSKRSTRWWAIGVATLVLIAGSGVAVALSRGDRGGPDAADRNPGPTPPATSSTPRIPLAPGRVVAASAANPPLAEKRFAMAARRGGVQVSAFGPVPSVRVGGAQKVAPENGSLVAFTLDDFCPTRGCVRWQRLGIRVVVGSVRSKLPSGGPTFVVAVSDREHNVELELNADGHDQRLSLTDGRPTGDNITVLAHELKRTRVARSAETIATTSPLSFDYPWGRASVARRHAVVVSAHLQYFVPGLTPKNADRALLLVEAYYDYSAYGVGDRHPFGEDEVHFLPAGGRPLAAISGPSQGTAGGFVYVFDVPGSLTRGSFVMGAQGLPRATTVSSATVPAGTPYRLSLSSARIPVALS